MSKQMDIPLAKWMEDLQGIQVTRSDMNKLIMNYLVTEGFKEAAEKFQEESGTDPGIELSSLDNKLQIREAVQDGRLEEAITMVNDIHPELLDTNRYLYFHLQQQHLIELIRQRDIEGALAYAQSHLAEHGEEDNNVLPELERTLALLAFEQPDTSPFADLLEVSQRQKVASELNAAILEAENREPTPKLSHLLKLLLWSQDQLESKQIKFPQMNDVTIGELTKSS
ncbi:glucose-induced degradation protein 8-B homolog isoform X3 [Apostichopus japonicus]|uniref:glucose-induced degradation protein 8-B homolog isoform X3 n=1 Tax=Stichopus japonicus TaxID=307972 RepID=UPI003AB27C84